MSRYYDRKVERGIVRRHDAPCPAKDGGRCRCRPRYIARATVNGVRRTSPTVDSIEAARAQIRRLHAGGGRTPKDESAVSGPTVREVFKGFISDARAEIALNRSGEPYKERAIDDYEHSYFKHADDDLGARPIREVTAGDVQELLDRLARKKARPVNGGPARPLSASRRHSVATGLRAAFRWAAQRGKCERGVLAGLSLPRVAKRARVVLTPPNVAKIILPLKGRALVGHAIAAYTNARSQEVGGIAWADVNWRTREIKLAEDPRARKTPAAQRTVPILDPLYPILRAEWERQGRPIGKVSILPGNTRPARRASEMRRDAVEQWEDAGVDAVGMHVLRHAWITWALAAGLPLPDLRDLAGHESGEAIGAGGVTVDVYGHAMDGYVERARVRMNTWIAEQTQAAANEDDDVTEVAQ